MENKVISQIDSFINSNDDEYHKFLQELRTGSIDLGPIPDTRELEIASISSLVESWSKPSKRTVEINPIDLEVELDPLLNSYDNASYFYRELDLKSLEDEMKMLKIKIRKLIENKIKSNIFYERDAKEFLLKSKYTKNDFQIITDALDIDTSKKQIKSRNQYIILIVNDIYEGKRKNPKK